ncbi:MAG: efflux RND transporter periplasmic adaptor subunit [Enterocloster sp.]
MKKKIFIGVVIAAAFCAVVLSKLLGNKQFAQAVAPPVLEAQQPQIGDIRLTSSLIGKIEPSDVVYIYPKAAGDVTSVSVKAGDIVSQGQVICTIDTKQVETSKSNMDSAALALKQAQEELGRQQILYSSGGISAQAYEQYRDNVTSAELQYDRAKYTYETQLEYSEIKAPIDGLVEICDMEVFDTVSQNNLICVISGQGNRVVSFNATERIRNYLREGDQIKVEKDKNTYEGTIYEISTMADETTGLYKVKASLNGDAMIPTGSEVKLYVTSEKTENTMTIPVDAVYYENGEPYVYVYQDGAVYRRDIETGIYDSVTMEVLSGLSMEDQVITTWSSELYEGAEVILKNQGADSEAETQNADQNTETQAETE